MTHAPAVSVQPADAATGEEWPILSEYERPLTTRLDHLIANRPTIQTLESNDRKAAAHPHSQHTDDEPHHPPPTDSHHHQQQQQYASNAQQGRGAKRNRETSEGSEEKELMPPQYLPTFRGSGNVEDDDDRDEDDGTDEERLGRVQPDDLYDPQMDERDEQRLQQARALPSGRQSDAVLSCPCCLTTLCLDCQRHIDLPHQYRAMFVSHIHITDRRVHPTTTQQQQQRQRQHRRQRGAGKGRRERDDGDGQTSDAYFAVECAECGTEVGAVDGDEVYYFFDVLDSASGQ